MVKKKKKVRFWPYILGFFVFIFIVGAIAGNYDYLEENSYLSFVWMSIFLLLGFFWAIRKKQEK